MTPKWCPNLMTNPLLLVNPLFEVAFCDARVFESGCFEGLSGAANEKRNKSRSIQEQR